jgi:hypothetical protein
MIEHIKPLKTGGHYATLEQGSYSYYEPDDISVIAYLKCSLVVLGTEAVDRETIACLLNFSRLPGSYNSCFTKEGFASQPPEEQGEPCLVLPVYAYVHGGATISTAPFSCSFDSGLSGAAYMTYKNIMHEFGAINEEALAWAKAYLESVVKEFDCYIQGEAYTYSIYCPKTGANIESLSGLVGYKYALQEVNSALISADKALDKAESFEEREREYWMDRGVMTVTAHTGGL